MERSQDTGFHSYMISYMLSYMPDWISDLFPSGVVWVLQYI